MNIDDFKTPLGNVELNLCFNTQYDSQIVDIGTSKFIKSSNSVIEIIAFDNISEWSKDTIYYPVEKTKGWIIRITKTTNEVEQIKIKCELKNNDTEVRFSPDSGEHLDAIWIENKTHFLNIGTEDGEVLKSRAIRNDYMPMRFAEQLGYHSERFSFTNYLDLGFETILPELMIGEKVYLHYLVAINPRKKSTGYPNDDISTSFAVDFSKRTLIERLKINE